MAFRSVFEKHRDGGFPRNGSATPTTQGGRPALKDTNKPATSTTATDEPTAEFTETERAAIKDRAQELRAAKRRGDEGMADEDEAVLTKIAEMSDPDRAWPIRVDVVISTNAPDLAHPLRAHGRRGRQSKGSGNVQPNGRGREKRRTRDRHRLESSGLNSANAVIP